MTEECFIDTAYLVALLDPRDSVRARALALNQRLDADRRPFVTSDAVLIEVANYFSSFPWKVRIVDFMQSIRTFSDWTVVPLTSGLLARAEARYRQFSDKNWSLTDCISMEVMAERRIHEIATSDLGFAQAGFGVLMA